MLVGVNKIFTAVGYIAYPLLLVLVAASGVWIDLAKFIVVPAIGFVVLSVFRSWYNAPRPYEVADIEPLIKKDTKGKSFPSRHAFSMMMIACSWLAYCVPVGVVLALCACVLAAIRVVGGVHFTRDVIAGLLFAVICALIGYVLVPW